MGIAKFAKHVVVNVDQCFGLVGAQRSECGGVLAVQEQRVGFSRSNNGVFPVGVDGTLCGRDHASAHLHAFGAERKRCGHGRAVADAASGDDRHIDSRPNER